MKQTMLLYCLFYPFLTFKECVMCTITVSKGKLSTSHIPFPFSLSQSQDPDFAQLKKQLKHRPLQT